MLSFTFFFYLSKNVAICQSIYLSLYLSFSIIYISRECVSACPNLIWICPMQVWYFLILTYIDNLNYWQIFIIFFFNLQVIQFYCNPHSGICWSLASVWVKSTQNLFLLILIWYNPVLILKRKLICFKNKLWVSFVLTYVHAFPPKKKRNVQKDFQKKEEEFLWFYLIFWQ